jgi:hypothetical protein
MIIIIVFHFISHRNRSRVAFQQHLVTSEVAVHALVEAPGLHDGQPQRIQLVQNEPVDEQQ